VIDDSTAHDDATAPQPTGGRLTDHPVLDFHIHPCIAELLGPSAHAYISRANPDAYAQIDCLADARATVDYLRGQGVDQAVVLAEESPVTDGVTSSEWVLDWTADIPELHAFVCLNPFTDADLVERLDGLIERGGGLGAPGGVKGIKFLPPYQQFWPNDARMYPLYGRAQDLGLPITFHTGLSRFAGTRLKYGDPLLLDDVAVDFPRLRILLAHAGRGPWYDRAELLAKLHPHVYLDIAGLPHRNLPRYLPDYRRLADKIVFGSDFPGLASITENIEAILELYPPDEARMVLWENGARLLGLVE
jgi:uncharacterized protein